MSKPTIKGQVIKKHLDDPVDGQLETRALARKLHTEYPNLYKNIEAARRIIRYYTGNDGEATRKRATHPKLPAENAKKKLTPNPLGYELDNFERTTPAKVLVFDIETSPLLSWIWSIWQKHIPLSALIDDWFMLTWSAKWLFEDKVYSAKIRPSEVRRQDDRRIVESIWKMIDQADIIIAHNGAKFDIKRLNTRFLLHGLPSPSPYQMIDTLLAARKNLSLTSFKLDYIGEYFGLGKKIPTDFSLWERVMHGDKEAIDQMSEYNDQDVNLLEDVYLKLRPYIKPHPNLGLYIGENVDACPSCGSLDLRPGGEYYTTVNVYEAYICGNCGSRSRSRRTSTPIRVNGKIKSSLPK